jgi:hypothetical protein
MWELLCWELPWVGVNPFVIMKSTAAGERLPIPARDDLPDRGGDFADLDAYIALMRRCWAQNPADRPGFGEIIASLRWVSLTVTACSSPQQLDKIHNSSACLVACCLGKKGKIGVGSRRAVSLHLRARGCYLMCPSCLCHKNAHAPSTGLRVSIFS